MKPPVPKSVKTVQALYKDSWRWIKGYYAAARNRTIHGFISGAISDIVVRQDANCFCLAGAIRRIYPDTYPQVNLKVTKIIKKLYPRDACFEDCGDSLIVKWNDAERRTIHEIRKVVKLAKI